MLFCDEPRTFEPISLSPGHTLLLYSFEPAADFLLYQKVLAAYDPRFTDRSDLISGKLFHVLCFTDRPAWGWSSKSFHVSWIDQGDQGNRSTCHGSTKEIRAIVPRVMDRPGWKGQSFHVSRIDTFSCIRAYDDAAEVVIIKTVLTVAWPLLISLKVLRENQWRTVMMMFQFSVPVQMNRKRSRRSIRLGSLWAMPSCVFKE